MMDTVNGLYNYWASGIGHRAEKLAHASKLWGGADGPADALRHVSRAAMLALKFGEDQARAALNLREMSPVGSDTNTAMDYYNNEIGIKIGNYLRSKYADENGKISDADMDVAMKKAEILSQKLVEASLKGEDLKTWNIQKGGIITHPDNKKVELEEGLEVSLPAFAKYSESEQVPLKAPGNDGMKHQQ